MNVSPRNSAPFDATCPADPATAWRTALDDGSSVTIRPIGADDAEREREFIENLSPEARYHRFLSGMVHPSAAMIKKFTEIDHDRDEAYVALTEQNGKTVQIGVSRFYSDADRKSCECAIAIADAWQHKGLGVRLMQRLIATAKARGIERMYSIDSIEDGDMSEFAAFLGFTAAANPDDRTQVIHTLTLA